MAQLSGSVRGGLLALLLAWFLALDSAGQSTWRRTYGGEGSDQARSVRALEGGGFLVAGSTGSFGPGGDIYVLRLNDEGEVEWSNYYGGPGAQTGVACAELADGYAVAGTTSTGTSGGYDMLLIKLDAGGGLVWEKHIGSTEWDICNDMVALADGFVLVGVTYGFGVGSGDAWVVRTDLDGDTLWTRHFGGPGLDEALGVHVDPVGNVLVVGRVDVNTEEQDAFVARMTPDGALDWLDRTGGGGEDHLSGITSSPGGGYVAVGGTRSYEPVMQVLVRGMDQQGDSLWQVMFGVEADTWMDRIAPRTDGGYAMVGHNNASNAGGRDMFLILVGEQGEWHLGKNYGSAEDEEGYGLEVLDNGFILVGAATHYGPGARAAFVVRCNENGETDDDTVIPYVDVVGVPSIVRMPEGPWLYPNPSNGQFFLAPGHEFDRLSLYDLTGRMVAEHQIGPATSALQVDQATGTYLAVLWFGAIRAGVVRVEVLRP